MDAVLTGTGHALSVHGRVADQYTKAEAYRLYGRSDVDRWIAEGLIRVSKKCIVRVELERVAAASNRVSYLPVAER